MAMPQNENYWHVLSRRESRSANRRHRPGGEGKIVRQKGGKGASSDSTVTVLHSANVSNLHASVLHSGFDGGRLPGRHSASRTTIHPTSSPSACHQPFRGKGSLREGCQGPSQQLSHGMSQSMSHKCLSHKQSQSSVSSFSWPQKGVSPVMFGGCPTRAKPKALDLFSGTGSVSSRLKE